MPCWASHNCDFVRPPPGTSRLFRHQHIKKTNNAGHEFWRHSSTTNGSNSHLLDFTRKNKASRIEVGEYVSRFGLSRTRFCQRIRARHDTGVKSWGVTLGPIPKPKGRSTPTKKPAHQEKDDVVTPRHASFLCSGHGISFEWLHRL